MLRWHTRVPVADPARVTTDLVAALKSRRKTVYVALHANHPSELTPTARAACARILDAGIPMLSQTVLLKGVNDDPDTLAALMRAFVETRVKPYYLHHPDLAPGHVALPHVHRGGPGADAGTARPPVRHRRSRPTCSTSPAATARCPWVQATSKRAAVS